MTLDTDILGEPIVTRHERSFFGRAIDYLARAPRALLAATVALGFVALAERARADVITAPLGGPNPTNIVYIYEDDGVPQITEAEPDDGLIWRYIAVNNSDSQPPAPDGPYNENLISVIISDVYSSQQPMFGVMQSGWYGIASPNGTPDLWNIELTTDLINYEILPGQSGIFEVATFKPHGQNIIYGSLEAQGFLISAPTYPVQVEGSVIPEPASMTLLAMGGLALLWRKKRRRVASELSVPARFSDEPITYNIGGIPFEETENPPPPPAPDAQPREIKFPIS